MRLIIAILLGALTFQGSSFELGLRGYNANTQRNDKASLTHQLLFRIREKRSGNSRQTRTVQTVPRYSNSRKVKIISFYQFCLQVSKDGRVNGTKNDQSPNVLFRIESYGTSKVRLFNIAQKRYVAINHKGVVFSEESMTDESLFHYYSAHNHDRFSSTKYPLEEADKRDKWLLTIKKSGKVKNAKRTGRLMKATHFLLSPAD